MDVSDTALPPSIPVMRTPYAIFHRRHRPHHILILNSSESRAGVDYMAVRRASPNMTVKKQGSMPFVQGLT